MGETCGAAAPQVPAIAPNSPEIDGRGPDGPPSDPSRRSGFWRVWLSRKVDGLVAPAGRLCRSSRWVVTAILLGTAPFGLSAALDASSHQIVTAVGLAWVCAACARNEAWWKGLAVVAVTFASHSAAVLIAATVLPPSERTFPGGEAYWQKQVQWIETGEDPEYDPRQWVGVHLQLLGATTVTSCTSLGAVTFARGFYEVDLMNYYVGRLLIRSRNGALAFLLGWHVWSVLRGLGYLALTWELLRVTFLKITGRPAMIHVSALILGLACLGADGVAKYLLMEPVRAALAANLQ